MSGDERARSSELVAISGSAVGADGAGISCAGGGGSQGASPSAPSERAGTVRGVPARLLLGGCRSDSVTVCGAAGVVRGRNTPSSGRTQRWLGCERFPVVVVVVVEDVVSGGVYCDVGRMRGGSAVHNVSPLLLPLPLLPSLLLLELPLVSGWKRGCVVVVDVIDSGDVDVSVTKGSSGCGGASGGA